VETYCLHDSRYAILLNVIRYLTDVSYIQIFRSLKVFKAVNILSTILWVTTPYSLVLRNQYFEETCMYFPALCRRAPFVTVTHRYLPITTLD